MACPAGGTPRHRAAAKALGAKWSDRWILFASPQNEVRKSSINEKKPWN
jgi:hypothetical protein